MQYEAEQSRTWQADQWLATRCSAGQQAAAAEQAACCAAAALRVPSPLQLLSAGQRAAAAESGHPQRPYSQPHMPIIPLHYFLQASELRRQNEASSERLVEEGQAAHQPLAVPTQYAASFG